MKAIICTKYGPPEVLKLREVETPVPVKNEIRIKIRETTVTSSDCILRGFDLPWWHPMGLMMSITMGFGRPRNPILGMVAAGEVDATATEVTRFRTGDRVVAYTVLSPAKAVFGTYAQYVCIPEDWIVEAIPPDLSYEVAAAIPYPGELAMFYLRKGEIERRRNVLIVGASGSIGSTAVQLARHYGATVTGVCSTSNVDLVKSLGAEQVIDYTVEDYSQRAERYDLILDAVPQQTADRKRLRSQARNSLTPDGVYVSIDDGLAKTSREYLAELLRMAASGELKPLIDRSYSLDQIVEAHRYVETGRKKGNVMVLVDHDD